MGRSNAPTSRFPSTTATRQVRRSTSRWRVCRRDPSRRIGSLVVNPGGPGAPGIPYLRSLIDSLPGELRDRFDLVSFDPAAWVTAAR